MAVKMFVDEITIDQTGNAPVVVLKDENGKRKLPIWIGILEASAIAAALEKQQFARPMTHDLFSNTLHELGIMLEKIVVSDLLDNTYYARLHLMDRNGKRFEIDARPSDSIALAVRMEADIYVEEGVLSQARSLDEKAETELKKLDEEKLKEILENLDEDDLGKYRM